ncbi:MAG: potassium-transporting ATPase subunit C [Gammaproteobacteria bacterium]
MKAMLRPALLLFVLLSLLTGVLYPLAVTGLAQVLLPHQANGSIVTVGGKPVGSMLISQQFSSPGYFWRRPSATGPYPYNAAALPVIHERWEPETSARNLRLIHEARAARGESVPWAQEIEDELERKAKG